MFSNKEHHSLDVIGILELLQHVQFSHCLAKMLKIRSERDVNNNTIVGFHRFKPISKCIRDGFIIRFVPHHRTDHFHEGRYGMRNLKSPCGRACLNVCQESAEEKDTERVTYEQLASEPKNDRIQEDRIMLSDYVSIEVHSNVSMC